MVCTFQLAANIKPTFPVFRERQFWMRLIRFSLTGIIIAASAMLSRKLGVAAVPEGNAPLAGWLRNQRDCIAHADFPAADDAAERAAATFYSLLQARP